MILPKPLKKPLYPVRGFAEKTMQIEALHQCLQASAGAGRRLFSPGAWAWTASA